MAAVTAKACRSISIIDAGQAVSRHVVVGGKLIHPGELYKMDHLGYIPNTWSVPIAHISDDQQSACTLDFLRDVMENDWSF